MEVEHSYVTRYKQTMDAFSPGLWQNLDKITELDDVLARHVLDYLLEMSCQATNMLNIQLGRDGLLGIPRNWLLVRIEEAAAPLLALNEYWEYLRLLEVYELLDDNLSRRLIAFGLNSPEPDIKEAAQDHSRP